MRTMLKLQIPVEAGNEATRTGRIADVLGGVIERIQPEAMYFLTENGLRTAHLIFDLKDPSVIPVIAEPLFSNLNAAVDFVPVMTLDELQKGLRESTSA